MSRAVVGAPRLCDGRESGGHHVPQRPALFFGELRLPGYVNFAALPITTASPLPHRVHLTPHLTDNIHRSDVTRLI